MNIGAQLKTIANIDLAPTMPLDDRHTVDTPIPTPFYTF